METRLNCLDFKSYVNGVEFDLLDVFLSLADLLIVVFSVCSELLRFCDLTMLLAESINKNKF